MLRLMKLSQSMIVPQFPRWEGGSNASLLGVRLDGAGASVVHTGHQLG